MRTGGDHGQYLLDAYLRLAAGRGAALPAKPLRERLGTQLDLLMASGAAELGRPLSVVHCSHCFEGHTAEIDYDPSRRRNFFFCAEAGRVEVDDKDLETVQFNMRWLLDQLAQALNIKPSPPQRTLIEGAAWWLGDTEVGRTQVSIAVAIGIRSAAELQQVAAKLKRHPPPGLGTLLVAGNAIPAYIGKLTMYEPIPVEDIFRLEEGMININRPQLEAWVRGLLRGQDRRAPGKGGRPPKRSRVLILFDERRQRGELYVNKLREANAIRAEWLSRFPDENAPKPSTIRSHLP